MTHSTLEVPVRELPLPVFESKSHSLDLKMADDDTQIMVFIGGGGVNPLGGLVINTLR